MWRRTKGLWDDAPVLFMVCREMNGANVFSGLKRLLSCDMLVRLPLAAPCPLKTLGDEHPVTEESMQALASAGGSLSPRLRQDPSAAGTVAATPPVDPPPPSLECLASFKNGQDQERQVKAALRFSSPWT